MVVILKLLILALAISTSAEGKAKLLQRFNLNLVLEGLKSISLSSRNSCGLHINEYISGLTSGKLWAQKMHDASAQTLHGIYIGNNKFLGHYDECLSGKHPENLFESQYCLLNVDIFDEKNGLEIFHVHQHEEFGTHSKYYSALFGVCIPSTCNSKEITDMLGDWFNRTEEAGSIYINLYDYNCYTKKDTDSKKIDSLVLYCLITLCILNFCSTAYDIVQRFFYKNEPQKLLASFSIYTNSSYIFRDPSDDLKLKSVNGIRACIALLAVYVHLYLWQWEGSAENTRDLIEDQKRIGFLNFSVGMDLIFFITAFLLSYLVLLKVAYFGYYVFPLAIISRYIRLTPLLAFVRWINGRLFLNLGDGPLWNHINKQYTEPCKENWASALLYTWNYVDPGQKCMAIGYTLNIDMQLSLLSPLILIPALLYPSWAYFYLTCQIVIATIISFTVSYVHGIQPQVNKRIHFWEVEYIPTHTRAASWLVGMLFGYILYVMHKKRMIVKLSSFQMLIGWTISLIFVLGTFVGNYFLPENASNFLGALCISLQKIVFVLGWAWAIFACKQGFGGLINDFFSSRILQVISKLSYSMLLVHFWVILYLIGIKRTNYTAGLEMINLVPTGLLLTIIISFILAVLVEIPVNNIYTYVLKSAKILPSYNPAKELKEKKTE